MSLQALASGTLTADPVHRNSAKGAYVTAMLRVPTDDGGILASAIAFGAAADRLAECGAGDALSISGRARLTQWIGRDRQQRYGISILVEQIATVRPRRQPRRADANRSASAPRPHRRPYPAPRPAAVAADPATLSDPLTDLWPEGER